MDDLRSLIDAWRAATRAAASEDYGDFRPDYARRADAYALCIRANVGRMLG